MKALIPVIIVAFAELASARLAQAQSAADRARALGGALQNQAETAIGEPTSTSKVPHYAGASPPEIQLGETSLGPKATQEWSSSGTGQMVQGAFSSGPSHTVSGQEDWLQNAKGVISQSAVGAAYQHCRTIATGGSGEAVETQKCSVARAVKAQKTCTRNYVAQVRVWHKYQCFGTRASKRVCTASREFRTAGGPPSGYSGCTHKGSVGRDGGSEIYSCCTRYKTDYLAEVKQCSAMSDCIQKNRACVRREGSECTKYQYAYECPSGGRASNKVSYHGVRRELVSDGWQGCESDLQNCAVSERKCLSAENEQRTINGMALTRECWQDEMTLVCYDGSARASSPACESLEADGCSYRSEACSQQDEHGNCILWERNYVCSAGGSTPSETRTICTGGTRHCPDGNCSADTNYTPSSDLGIASANLSALREISGDMDKGLAAGDAIFMGDTHHCRIKPVGQFIDCCQPNKGLITRHFDGFCRPLEEALAAKRDAGLCVRVPGAHCSETHQIPFGSVCLTRQQGYCCFVSKLARIIQQQGRGQLGMGWGSAETPDCTPLTISQIEQIDFSALDLSEIFPEIYQAAENGGFGGVKTEAQTRIQQYYTNQQSTP